MSTNFSNITPKQTTPSNKPANQPLNSLLAKDHWIVLITLALFFSGVFVFLTPMPLVYHCLKRKTVNPSHVSWISLALVSFTYIFGSQFFYNLYQTHPSTAWLFPVPYIELLGVFNVLQVQLIGIGYFVMFLVIGHLIAYSLQHPVNQMFKKSFFSIGALYVGMLIIIAFVIYPQSEMFISSFHEHIKLSIAEYIKLQETNSGSLEMIAFMKGNTENIVKYSLYLQPFLLFFATAFLYVFNLLLAKRFFAFFFKSLSNLRLNHFQLPYNLSWVTLGLIGLLLIDKKFLQSDFIFYTAINILLACCVVYFLQGFAILIHFLDRKNIFGLLRFMIFITLIVMNMTAVSMITLVGFLDHWLDTRKMNLGSSSSDHPSAKTPKSVS